MPSEVYHLDSAVFFALDSDKKPGGYLRLDKTKSRAFILMDGQMIGSYGAKLENGRWLNWAGYNCAALNDPYAVKIVELHRKGIGVAELRIHIYSKGGEGDYGFLIYKENGEYRSMNNMGQMGLLRDHLMGLQNRMIRAREDRKKGIHKLGY